jgi:hypothetical protein
MWARRGALPGHPPGARIVWPRRRNADGRPNAEDPPNADDRRDRDDLSDPDDRPNAEDPPNAEGRSDPDDPPNADDRRDVEDPRKVEFRGMPREGDERLKSEPPSSDRPVLELLNPEIRSAELPDLVPPKAEPSPAIEPCPLPASDSRSRGTLPLPA